MNEYRMTCMPFNVGAQIGAFDSTPPSAKSCPLLGNGDLSSTIIILATTSLNVLQIRETLVLQLAVTWNGIRILSKHCPKVSRFSDLWSDMLAGTLIDRQERPSIWHWFDLKLAMPPKSGLQLILTTSKQLRVSSAGLPSSFWGTLNYRIVNALSNSTWYLYLIGLKLMIFPFFTNALMVCTTFPSMILSRQSKVFE